MKPAAFALGLILLALPLASRADENLVAKREACRQEARARIGLREKVDVDGYRRIVERRSAHVSQCMTRVFVARNEAPLPPRKVLHPLAGELPSAQIVSGGKRSLKLVRRKERRKLQGASIKVFKAQSSKRRRLEGFLGRSK